MAANVERTTQQVRAMLEELTPFDVDADGDFTFRHESTQIFVRVGALGEDHTVVTVWAITNAGVPPSTELYRWLALNNDWTFGSFQAEESSDGVSIIFRHALLGDFLDQAEFEVAILAIAGTADDLDDKIKYQFGGRTFHG
ncbi:MAG: hypothetical protein AB7I38_16580 [Dehalococcoidia bacterium]